MSNLKEVRNRIVSVSSTQQITRAMKMVAAAKLKRASDAIVQLRSYVDEMTKILANISTDLEKFSSPYTQERELGKVLLIGISSNRGLAGAFNANVCKHINHLLVVKYAEQYRRGDIHLMAIGKKVQDFYAKRQLLVMGHHHELYQELTFENVSKVAESVMQLFVAGEYDQVDVVYNQFKSPVIQLLVAEQLLPLKDTAIFKVSSSEQLDPILEPSQQKILANVIPKLINLQLYQAILDSYASEHGARMIAMDKATDNAGDLLKALRLSYNQARQAAITTELTEIVSGAAALSNG